MSDDFGTEGVLVPDLPEPIRAYRAWKWNGERLTGWGEPWPTDGPLHAVCAPSGGSHYAWGALMYAERPVLCVETPSPTGDGHKGYGCGIYAYSTVEQMAKCAGFGEGTVWGEVELGGKVYEHDHGWRAEYGQVVALYATPGSASVRHAAVAYGVPVKPLPFSQAEVDELRRRDEKDDTATLIRMLGQTYSGSFTTTTNLLSDPAAARLIFGTGPSPDPEPVKPRRVWPWAVAWVVALTTVTVLSHFVGFWAWIGMPAVPAIAWAGMTRYLDKGEAKRRG